MNKYDAKWTGYGHVITIKLIKNKGHGQSAAVYKDGVVQAILDDVNHARALFTGLCNMVRDEQINR